MKTPEDKRITLSFYSHTTKTQSFKWKAGVTFEPGSTDDSMASIEVTDGEGAPIAEAVFEFAGKLLDVRDGKASIRCGDFVKGKHETAVWLHQKGESPIPGVLTFA